MFFAHVARVLSILLLIFGAFLVLTALSIAFDWFGLPRDVAMSRYLPASKTTGEAIDGQSLLASGLKLPHDHTTLPSAASWIVKCSAPHASIDSLP